MEPLQSTEPHRWWSGGILSLKSIFLGVTLVSLLPTSRGYIPDHPIDDGAHQWLLFPNPSSAGLFVAMAVPLETVNKDVSVAFNYDASYDLPANATELSIMEAEFGFKKRGTRAVNTLRDVTRGIIYEGFQKALGRMGLPERPCLLQAICEAAERPMGLDEHDLLADIVHLVLTPSRSKDPDVHEDFHKAERLGKEGADCAAEFSNCGYSILSLISAN